MRYLIGLLIAAVGVGLIMYPHYERSRQDAAQQKLMAQLDELAAIEEEEPAASANSGGNSDLRAAPQTGVTSSAAAGRDGEPAAPVQTAQTSSKSKTEAIGLISIPAIDAKLPIVEGIGSKSLKLGAGHFPGTALPGEVGNAAIAAHRSYTYGRMFNRLGELEKGDAITVTRGKIVYTYKVTDKFVVDPDEISILKQPAEGKYLTLVTCEPIRVATHRLIIRAVAAED